MGKSNDDELRDLQVGLVRYQAHAIEAGLRDLVIFEGRDAAGKDGAIKRIVEHLSVRHTRVLALPKPDERERSEWYFQRYVKHLPAAGEFVIFNRSWYNRGGVERVMEFATAAEIEMFLRDVPVFERMLLGSGVRIVKMWLDISRDEQAKRLKARREDPLKALKVSNLDAVAELKWDAYSDARDEMLTRTHSDEAPWTVIRTDDKPTARSNIIRHLLKTLAPKDITRDVSAPDKDVLYAFEPESVKDGRLEH
ncbi:polyphosphate kinase 2 [uncultured Phenylobacterium sp.]|uniref:polyphosphate kinase 2 n=1 Tax=uncultured Phenylobacterium sp. TaxID=349273 RepID=UPI0026009C4B|nr:polyphosphate kinase 2 [uncultured Phenylobacterium sp.]